MVDANLAHVVAANGKAFPGLAQAYRQRCSSNITKSFRYSDALPHGVLRKRLWITRAISSLHVDVWFSWQVAS